MSRTEHIPAAIVAELRARRQPRPPVRRTGTRQAIVAAAIRETEDQD